MPPNTRALCTDDHDFIAWVRQEGEICAHQFMNGEQRRATRLTRAGVLRSFRGRDGCTRRHYQTTD